MSTTGGKSAFTGSSSLTPSNSKTRITQGSHILLWCRGLCVHGREGEPGSHSHIIMHTAHDDVTHVTLREKLTLVLHRPCWLIFCNYYNFGQHYMKNRPHTIGTNIASKIYMVIKCYITHVTYQRQQLKHQWNTMSTDGLLQYCDCRRQHNDYVIS